MAKFNFDVQGVDHKKAARNFESPKPGMYRAKVAEMNPGFSKDNAGKPDPSRPKIEVVFHLQDKEYDQTPMWYHLTFGEGYPKVKFDQFLQAVGVNTTKKAKGSLDTDSFIGKIVNVRVRAGATEAGEYRGEVAGVFAAPQDEEDLDEDEADEDDLDEEDEDLAEEGDEDEPEDEDDGLDALSIKEIRALAKEKGLDSTGVKAAVIERIRGAASEEEEEEESDEDEAEDEDDGYDELSVAELKQEFKDRELDLPTVRGPVAKQKVALIAALRANDEEPF